MKCYVGIDPGLDGGIAVITKEEIIALRKMPVIKQSKKRVIDIAEIVCIFQNLKFLGDCHVYIESVAAMPKQGVTSTFNFGMGFGILQGICAGRELPYTLVKPQEWKRTMLNGTDKSKGAAIVRAKQLYPHINLKPGQCKKDQDGLAEALLIACYGVRGNGN